MFYSDSYEVRKIVKYIRHGRVLIRDSNWQGNCRNYLLKTSSKESFYQLNFVSWREYPEEKWGKAKYSFLMSTSLQNV